MNPSSIPGLISLLREAEGPSREIDAAIYNALVDDGGRVAFRVANWTRGRAPMLDRYHDGWLVGKSEDDIYANNLVHYTASLDAALALVSEKLPGWDYGIVSRNRLGKFGADIFRLDDLTARPTAWGPTAPLALCLSLLTALAAEDQA